MGVVESVARATRDLPAPQFAICVPNDIGVFGRVHELNRAPRTLDSRYSLQRIADCCTALQYAIVATSVRKEESKLQTASQLLEAIPVHLVVQRSNADAQEVSSPFTVLIAISQPSQDSGFFCILDCIFKSS